MIEMIPRVSLVSVGIFDFAEMRGFSSSGLYLREIAQRMHSSVSRYFVNGVRIREKNFSVLRLLQNMPAKTPPFSDRFRCGQMSTPILLKWPWSKWPHLLLPAKVVGFKMTPTTSLY